MNDFTPDERLGTWLAENDHRVVQSTRCPGRDGRVIAKVCDVEGLEWIWIPGNRVTRAEWMEELEELLPLPTVDGSGPEGVQAILDAHPETGGIAWPPRAFPADEPAHLLTSCPGCRLKYEIKWSPDTRTFAVQRQKR